MNLDQRAEQAKAEIRAMSQQARDSIAVKVGWMIRSDGQKRRYEKARREVVLSISSGIVSEKGIRNEQHYRNKG